MINNKYLILALVASLTVFGVAWSFNHVNPWLAFGLGFVIILGFNQYFKNKNK
jgi:hypothetical protein